MIPSSREPDRPTRRLICVSGGTSGIGAGLVDGFLAQGDQVYTFGRNPDRVARLAERYATAVADGHLRLSIGDVTDAAFRAGLAERIGAEAGRLDCLVNNAGVIRGGGTLEESVADWRETLEVNLIAPFALTQVCAPLLRLSAAPVVINISSACAQRPFATCTSTCYSVSKAGLDMLTRRLALGLGGEGIRVNGVAPGVVPSEMWGGDAALIAETVQRRHVLQQQAVDPQDVARAVLFLASAEARRVTGTILNVDAGYTLG